MTHEQRMAIAERLQALVLQHHGNDVLAVFVTSSTSKGLDLPHSDLELTVVLRDGVEVEAKSYIFQGMLIEIEYIGESKIVSTSQRVTSHWPVQADGYRNRLTLFERDGWTRRLDQAVDTRDASDFTLGIQGAMTALIEVRDKMRNAQIEGDEMNIRVFGAEVASEAANLVLFLNRRYMTTTRWYYRQAFECPKQPPDFRRLVEVVKGARPASLAQVTEAAERLCAECLRLANVQGITVESQDLIV